MREDRPSLRELSVALPGEAILAAARHCTRNGHITHSQGNISVRSALDHTDYWISPTGVPWSLMELEDVVPMDFGKEDPKASSEWRMHDLILSECADICAVVHTHPPYAVAESHRRLPLMPLHPESEDFTPFNGSIPTTAVLPEVANNFPREAVALKVMHLMEDGFRAVLMENHGLVVAGKSLAEAILLTDLAEHLAKVNYIYDSY